MVNRRRNMQIKFAVTSEEKNLIESKIELSNLPKGDFLRRIIIDGVVEVKNIENDKEKIEKVHNLTKQISKIGVNINQVAKHCNQIGSISSNDYNYLKERLDEIWLLLKTSLFDL